MFLMRSAHRCRFWVCLTTFASLAATSHAATNVAVIDASPKTGTSGVQWCNLLTGAGHQCTLFPFSGPTGPLDPYDVVIDLSLDWTDPTHLLADFLQSGKGVILWGGAAFALGVNTDPIVQAYIGATQADGGAEELVVVASDSILGPRPPGFVLHDCGDGPCSALSGDLPSAKVLARFAEGSGTAGILKTTWQTGRSIYLSHIFRPSNSDDAQIILRSVAEIGTSIPTVADWGLVILALGLLCTGLILLQRTRTKQGLVMITCLVAVPSLTQRSVLAQYCTGDALITCENNKITSLYLHDSNDSPFRETTDQVVDLRVVNVLNSEALLILWNELNDQGITHPFYAISLDGQLVSRVTSTSYKLHLSGRDFDPEDTQLAIDDRLAATEDNDLFLVQFFTQPLPEFLLAIQNAGGRLLGFLPNHTFVVRLTPVANEEVGPLEFVRSVQPFHPEYKLEKELLQIVKAELNPSTPLMISIQLWTKETYEDSAEAITATGGCVRRIDAEQGILEASLTAEQLREIAYLSEFAFFEVRSEIGFDVDNARLVSGADYLVPLGFLGDGVSGEVMDTGIKVSPLHEDFSDRPPMIHGTNSGDTWHGTQVYGLIFGNGSCQSNGQGILPNAQGIFASRNPYDDEPQDDCGEPELGGRYDHTAELVVPNGEYEAVFQSNSWGHDFKAGYTIMSRELDDIAFLLEPIPKPFLCECV